MIFFRLWVVLPFMTELFARDNKYAWNSTVLRTPQGRVIGLSLDVHRLLKQGLKIGYRPLTRYNGEFVVPLIFKNLIRDNLLSHEPPGKFWRFTRRLFF